MILTLWVCLGTSALAQDDSAEPWSVQARDAEHFEVLHLGQPISTRDLALATEDSTLLAQLDEALERAERRSWATITLGTALVLGSVSPLVVNPPEPPNPWAYAVDRSSYSDEALYRQDAADAAETYHLAWREVALARRARFTAAGVMLGAGVLTIGLGQLWAQSERAQLSRPDTHLTLDQARLRVEDLNMQIALQGDGRVNLQLTGSF